MLESRILGDGAESSSIAQHFNSLVKIISIGDKMRAHNSLQAVKADDIAVGMSAVQGQPR